MKLADVRFASHVRLESDGCYWYAHALVRDRYEPVELFHEKKARPFAKLETVLKQLQRNRYEGAVSLELSSQMRIPL